MNVVGILRFIKTVTHQSLPVSIDHIKKKRKIIVKVMVQMDWYGGT
jgi:hypothetical protein